MRRLADQHRTAVAQLEHESLKLKHQLLRGLCVRLSISVYMQPCQLDTVDFLPVFLLRVTQFVEFCGFVYWHSVS